MSTASSASAASTAAPQAVATSSTAAAPVTRAFFSGAVAGMVADSMLHPLDTINLRMKVQTQQTAEYSGILRSAKTIVRNEGIRGCFGGLTTTMMCSPVCASIYFGSYETLKSLAVPHVSEKNAGIVYFLSGAMSEALISTISVPAEVIKSRLQLGRNPHLASGGVIKYTKNYKGTFHAFLSIVSSEGIRGLYSGYSACLSVDTFFSAFSFLFYETIKQSYKQYIVTNEQHERPLTTAESLIMGSLAGGGSAFLTNPLDVMTVRLMTQGKSGRYNGLADCFMKTVGQEGVLALWKGASCRMTAIMPQMGICFGVYETIKRWFFEGELEDFDFEDLS
ncbi:hypothetical protein Poli38472_007359 [Pythium oligandrum]|uniref:Mitochondrial carrier protein n=1 Tax=Pythium oligandrum TaxID=41045 RepID=A0A8K1C9J1_PYTOL|nr:hypothetical protein Poli38472_007359 [Pythium oligandrum]|eukprot:TMW59214.1 hypothetical protein Poli38472_007359 [Pythium oligandrum]